MNQDVDFRFRLHSKIQQFIITCGDTDVNYCIRYMNS